jgi:hypothetical protein
MIGHIQFPKSVAAGLHGRRAEGKNRQVLELSGKQGAHLAPVSASAEICNTVVTHDSATANCADISKHEKLGHAGLKSV